MTSKRFAVLGNPIEHSKSPAIHLAAYKQLGLQWSYEKIFIESGGLAEFLKTAGKSYEGFSVTMPLKVEAAQIADTRDKLVSLTGVANTLVRTSDGLSAFNTDIFGVSKSLEIILKKPVEVIALLGAGATAKSVMTAIAKAKPNALFDIYVRDTSRVGDLLDLAGELDVFTSVHTLDEFSNFQDLTVNTLPLDASAVLPKHNQPGFLLNVNYSGADSDLVSSFATEKVVTGQTMLVWQALAQIRLFIAMDMNKPLPDEAQVLQAMRAAL